MYNVGCYTNFSVYLDSIARAIYNDVEIPIVKYYDFCMLIKINHL